jgi:hypothetical protein
MIALQQVTTQAGGRWSRWRTMEWAIGDRLEEAKEGGGGGIDIVQGRRDLATMREKYNINSGC